MVTTSIPTPPSDDAALHYQLPHSPTSSRRSTGSVKAVKPIHRVSKRAANHTPSHDHSHSHGTHTPVDGRHKRVWKACERCRMKKTKCDGEFPCKRCKDDGLVCTAGTRKKTEYKQLPKGYAEVLENSQFALIATVHKLYAMLRNSQQWDLGEPELNDRGQPVIHDIASKLGCIRPQNDLDLPVGNVIPEDEAGLADLASKLEAHQKERDAATTTNGSTPGMASPHISPIESDRASSAELDHSDFEMDYRKKAFAQLNDAASRSSHSPATTTSVLATLSPQSLACDFDGHSVASDMDAASISGTTLFPGASPVIGSFPAVPEWTTSRPVSMEFTPQQLLEIQAASASPMDVDTLLSQGLLESNFGTLKPHVVNCPNPEVMMGIGDPMFFSRFEDGDTLRM